MKHTLTIMIATFTLSTTYAGLPSAALKVGTQATKKISKSEVVIQQIDQAVLETSKATMEIVSFNQAHRYNMAVKLRPAVVTKELPHLFLEDGKRVSLAVVSSPIRDSKTGITSTLTDLVISTNAKTDFTHDMLRILGDTDVQVISPIDPHSLNTKVIKVRIDSENARLVNEKVKSIIRKIEGNPKIQFTRKASNSLK